MKTDCFACEGKCTTLRGQKCDTCSFYKTEAQLQAERDNSNRRLIKRGVWAKYVDMYGLNDKGEPATSRIRY